METKLLILNTTGLILIPLAATTVSFLNYKKNKSKVALEFLAQGNSMEQKQYRKAIYDAYKGQIEPLPEEELIALDELNGSVSQVASFYENWGMLYRQGYLPLETFKGINGATACRVFYMLKPYIKHRRETDNIIGEHTISNQSYGKDFEDLVYAIKKSGLVKISASSGGDE